MIAFFRTRKCFKYFRVWLERRKLHWYKADIVVYSKKIPFDYESEERKIILEKKIMCVCQERREKEFIHEILSEKSVEGNESSSLVHCVAILRTILEPMPSFSFLLLHSFMSACVLALTLILYSFWLFMQKDFLFTIKSRFQLKFELFRS